MDTTIAEVAPRIYSLSTFVPTVGPSGLTYNEFLVDADEPLLFHCGKHHQFASIAEAAARITPIERLRWISFGHLEADECGAMNDWLAAAPRATVAFNSFGCNVSIADLADRPPRPLEDGDSIDLGDRRLRIIRTPHVPHGWDAQVLFEESTRTLLCGDLFTQQGSSPALVEGADMITPALAAEDTFSFTSLTPSTAPTMNRLAGLSPTTLALMHGPTYQGDGASALRDLAAAYGTRLEFSINSA